MAGCHLEDQVLPKRCGHIAGKALISADEMVGKLRAIRDTADDLGNRDFVIAARTDAYSAVQAPETKRGMDLAIERGLRYLDTGIPDLLWCELPTSAREPVETFARQIRKRFPAARLAFNWSSSFKWYLDPDPLRFDELGALGYRFIFITLAAIHANGLGFARLLEDLCDRGAAGYVELQRQEWADGSDLDLALPTRSHHLFSGVPYHHRMGEVYGAARLSRDVHEELRDAAAV